MISPARILTHLKRMLLTLGVTIMATVLLGFLLAYWIWPGLADSPLLFALLAVTGVLPVLLALAALPAAASYFIHKLYNAQDPGDAHAFLNRLAFGSWTFHPCLVVKEGQVTRGKGSLLHLVGGPGNLVIYYDSAVVTERCGRLGRVLGPGFPRLERFEKIWEIVDLRPQRRLSKVNGMTREGIPVSCEADISFKIDDRVPDERGQLSPKRPTDKEPYPYTKEAVFKAATSRWIRDPEAKVASVDWTGRVVGGNMEGILRNILAEYRLDWLLAPTGPDTEHPREVIRRRLEREMHRAAPNIGARVLRLDLGEIWPKDSEIPRQWIKAWQTDWESRALATQVEGEAGLLRMDVAQAQAQAEMIITLTQALQSVASSEAELQPYLLATRLIEALRWLSYDSFSKAYMPPEALQTLEWIQRLLEKNTLPSGKTKTTQSTEKKT